MVSLRASCLMLERPAEVRFPAIGQGIHVLLVLGFPHPPTTTTLKPSQLNTLSLGIPSPLTLEPHLR